MQPTPQTEFHPPRPPLSQRVRELVVERRLPGKLERLVDIFRSEKTVRRSGLRFRVRCGTSDESFVESVAARGEYNPTGFEIRPEDIVVDVGGNIGTFACRAARVACRVITIEPNSENFRLLETNIRLNRLENVHAIRAAVCDSDGTIDLHCARHGGYHSILDGRGGPVMEIVPAVRLESIFDQITHCHFLKVDCEGAEHQIFGTLPTDVFARIDRIAMEWHGPENRDERIAQAQVLVGKLQSSGFHIDSFTECLGFKGGTIFAQRTS